MAVPKCYVYFDLPLHPEPLFTDDWVVRIDGRPRVIIKADALSDQVQIETGPAGPYFGGPDQVKYLDRRNELRGVDLTPVEAFIFPITRT